jgi:hypothetical protein
MQSLTQRSQPILLLLSLGLITLAAVWLSIATSTAQPQPSHRALPSAPDGRPVQPHAHQFVPPYRRPDFWGLGSLTLEELHDLLLLRIGHHMA